jgi:hypothetical protein
MNRIARATPRAWPELGTATVLLFISCRENFKMKLRTLAVSLVAIVGASYAIACGGNADANKANLDMSAPAHDNMSPTVGDGGVVNTTTGDLAKPSHVNESPAPAGTGH